MSRSGNNANGRDVGFAMRDLGRRAVLSLVAAAAASAGCARLRRPPPIAWIRSIEEAEALTYNYPPFVHRPIFLFFGAAWDNSSKELEEVTFRDPEVRVFVNEHYIPVSIDATDDEAVASRKPTERFKVKGSPTILVYSARFAIEVVRIIEFVSPALLLSKLGHGKD